jgi:hypothetical protein
MSQFSRRGFLKGAAVGAGLAMGTRLAGRSWLGEAKAAVEAPTVVVIHFVGGFNAIWGTSSAFLTPYQGQNFSVTATSFTNFGGAASPGGGVAMDNVIAKTLSPFSQQHVAVIGVAHGIAAHQAARQAEYTQGTQSAPLILADAMGGMGTIKAACIGNHPSEIPTMPVNGTSLQPILDMQSTINAMGGGAPNPKMPDRAKAAIGLTASQAMSKANLAANPLSEESLAQGYPSIISTLEAPVQAVSLSGLQSAYGITGTAITNFASKMAGAELMVLAGANVITVFDNSARWDSHTDVTGTVVRNGMTASIVGPLNTFLDRMLNVTGRNVVVGLVGDFNRDLTGSNHSSNATMAVFGKYINNGTSAATLDNRGQFGSGSGVPGIQGMWSFLAAAAKIPTVPAFAANPHPAGLIS